MDITPASLSELNTRYHIQFFRGLQAATPQWTEYAMLAESGTSTEKYPFTGRMPKFREWIGDRAFESIQAYDYTLKNRKFESSVGVPIEAIEDDQYGLWDSQFQDMGTQAVHWPNDIVLEALTLAESSPCYDGQNFFDTDHPVDPHRPSKGVQSNLLTGMPLTEENYSIARARMLTLTDENGRVLGIKPNAIGVSATNETKARKIVESTEISVTGGSTQTNVHRGSARVIVFPELDAVSTVDWFLFDLSRPVKPFLFQRRVAPQFQPPSMFAEHLAKTDKLLWGARARGAAGYALWQLALKCKG